MAVELRIVSRIVRGLAVAAAVATIATAGTGCAARPVSGHSEILADYNAGRYRQAYDKAAATWPRTQASTREEIGYLAGLSAYRLQRYSNAKTYLEPLTRGTNSEIAGNAAATLGLSAYEQGDYRTAVDRFKQAAERLTGEGKAEAAYYAGLSHQQLQQWSQARLQFQVARGITEDPALIQKLDAEIRASGFTLQLGVFTARDNAQKRAAEFNASHDARTLGEARVTQRPGQGGRTFHVVQVGEFPSYNAAERARQGLNYPTIITPLSGG